MKTYKDFISEAKNYKVDIGKMGRDVSKWSDSDLVKLWNQGKDERTTPSHGQLLKAIRREMTKRGLKESVNEGHPRFDNPVGEMFKDKFMHLWIVYAAQHGKIQAISYDPKWASLSSYGDADIENMIPWTKMVKKPIVQKFIRAIEFEMDMGGWFEGASDKFNAKEAIKYLKRMGR